MYLVGVSQTLYEGHVLEEKVDDELGSIFGLRLVVNVIWRRWVFNIYGLPCKTCPFIGAAPPPPKFISRH